MKNLIYYITLSFGLLFIVSGCSNKSSKEDADYENETIAVFNGLIENNFKFTDDNENELIFEEISEDLDIDLYEDEYIGKEMIVYWNKEMVLEKDSVGNETKNVKSIKIIVDLELVD